MKKLTILQTFWKHKKFELTLILLIGLMCTPYWLKNLFGWTGYIIGMIISFFLMNYISAYFTVKNDDDNFSAIITFIFWMMLNAVLSVVFFIR